MLTTQQAACVYISRDHTIFTKHLTLRTQDLHLTRIWLYAHKTYIWHTFDSMHTRLTFDSMHTRLTFDTHLTLCTQDLHLTLRTQDLHLTHIWLYSHKTYIWHMSDYVHKTYRINDEEVLVQRLLARLDLVWAYILAPHAECLPFSEQGKGGNLEQKKKNHWCLLYAKFTIM